MKRFLVTGAAGFVGHALCDRLLKDGHSVTGLDNYSRGQKDLEHDHLLAHPYFVFYECDLAHGIPADVYGEFEGVFHLAGVVGVENVLSKPYAAFENNVKILFEILGWLEKNKVKSFLYASSSEVYGWNDRIAVPTSESVSLMAPPGHLARGGYALSKINGEYLTQMKCLELNLPFSIVRFHNLYGPRMGNSHVIPQLWRKIKDAQVEVVVNNSDHTRAFCYITDAIDQMLESITKASSDVENIGNDLQEITMGDLAALIAQMMNKKIIIINEEVRIDPFKRRCPDMQLRRDRYGSRPSVAFIDGLKKTLAWYEDYR